MSNPDQDFIPASDTLPPAGSAVFALREGYAALRSTGSLLLALIDPTLPDGYDVIEEFSSTTPSAMYRAATEAAALCNNTADGCFTVARGVVVCNATYDDPDRGKVQLRIIVVAQSNTPRRDSLAAQTTAQIYIQEWRDNLRLPVDTDGQEAMLQVQVDRGMAAIEKMLQQENR